jgi:hypothetical protein
MGSISWNTVMLIMPIDGYGAFKIRKWLNEER